MLLGPGVPLTEIWVRKVPVDVAALAEQNSQSLNNTRTRRLHGHYLNFLEEP